MICQFTGTPCRYVECGLWDERLQACRHVLMIDKILGFSDKPPPELTPREYNILSLIARGYGNAAIAHQLNIEYSTVKNHVSNLLNKLGVKSRLEAVIFSIEQGIISVRSS